MSDKLKAPFPWFGGKSSVSNIVWSRFGDNISNYVEPFAGSLAVLLGRDFNGETETVNDKDGFVSNFWRALSANPDELAHWCDWPVNECDLESRHKWLVPQREDLTQKLKNDPEFYDVKIAGWWVWGLCSWIGSGWCPDRQRPHLGNDGMGIKRQLPHLGNDGRGIHRQRPHLGDDGMGILEYLNVLSNRIRRVRVCCGEWYRILGPTPTFKFGMTGVFLDPPYSVERSECYSVESYVSEDVRKWAIENGSNPLLRIALCGYEGEHEMPDDWECIAWKTAGGYGLLGNGLGRENSAKERIWFSPACIKPQPELF